MQAGGCRQANGGGKEQPVKRGDSGDQPGRGPGLEETLEQPAGPAAGLLRGRGYRETNVQLSLPGQEGREESSLRLETRAKSGLDKRES